jgi:hypothetical protein
MKVQKGGTDMWCPECKEVRTCKSIPGAQVTYNSADYSQRQHFVKHDDVNWFQRGHQDVRRRLCASGVYYQDIDRPEPPCLNSIASKSKSPTLSSGRESWS